MYRNTLTRLSQAKTRERMIDAPNIIKKPVISILKRIECHIDCPFITAVDDCEKMQLCGSLIPHIPAPVSHSAPCFEPIRLL